MTPAASADRLRVNLEKRLRREAAEFGNTETRLEMLRRRRREMALDLLAMGLSERTVGDIAGVSGARVHQWREQNNPGRI